MKRRVNNKIKWILVKVVIDWMNIYGDKYFGEINRVGMW